MLLPVEAARSYAWSQSMPWWAEAVLQWHLDARTNTLALMQVDTKRNAALYVKDLAEESMLGRLSISTSLANQEERSQPVSNMLHLLQHQP